MTWSTAGVTGALPPQFLRSTAAREVSALQHQMLREIRDSRPRGRFHALQRDTLAREISEQMLPWVEHYDEQATESLAEVSPRSALNLAFFEAACGSLRGRPDINAVPMRRWIWIVACAGGRLDNRPGVGLARFVQAAHDHRNISLIRDLARPLLDPAVATLTPMDHDQLISSRIRLGWTAAKVARAISKVEPEILAPEPLEDLISYVHAIATSPGWMSGRYPPIAPEAKQLARHMSLRPGQLAGEGFAELNASVAATTHPFVEMEGAILPVGLEAATARLHLPLFNVVREHRRPNQSAQIMERACAQILNTCPGITAFVGHLNLPVSQTNEGELDVVAIDRDRKYFLNLELKAHFERDLIPTTEQSFRQGIDAVSDQLFKRRKAFAAGSVPRQANKRLSLRSDAQFVGLAVVLHDYSGLIWRPQIPGVGLGCNVITIADLALITSIVRSHTEFFEYLDLREKLLTSGRGAVGDELDLLAAFLEFGHDALCAEIPTPEERRMLVMPPRDAPDTFLQGMHEPDREEARRMIANLPRVRVIS